MKFSAAINIMPHKELLDPQGKTVKNNLASIDISNVEDIRIGKHIEMKFEADSREQAEALLDKACKKMFANVIMETYSFDLTEEN